MAGVLGVVVGGVIAWFLVADTFNRKLAASLEWALAGVRPRSSSAA
jgi:hypothetical protein